MKGLCKEVYIHPTAKKYGHVSIGEGASFWPYSVIRSEVNQVNIGAYTNIQDFVMIHVGTKHNVEIGDYCSIAHRAVIHGAKIGSHTLIGVGSIVMDGAIIGDNVIIGAGAYVPSGVIIPDNTVYEGNPLKLVKERNNYVANTMNAVYYNINGQHYREEDYRSWSHETVKRKTKDFFALIRKEYKQNLSKVE